MDKPHEQTPVLFPDDALQKFEAAIAMIPEIREGIDQVSQQILALHEEVGEILGAGTLSKDPEVPADAKTVVKSADTTTAPHLDPTSSHEALQCSSKDEKNVHDPMQPSKETGDTDLSEIDGLLEACGLPIDGTVQAKRQRLISHARMGTNFMPRRQ